VNSYWLIEHTRHDVTSDVLQDNVTAQLKKNYALFSHLFNELQQSCVRLSLCME